MVVDWRKDKELAIGKGDWLTQQAGHPNIDDRSTHKWVSLILVGNYHKAKKMLEGIILMQVDNSSIARAKRKEG